MALGESAMCSAASPRAQPVWLGVVCCLGVSEGCPEAANEPCRKHGGSREAERESAEAAEQGAHHCVLVVHASKFLGVHYLFVGPRPYVLQGIFKTPWRDELQRLT